MTHGGYGYQCNPEETGRWRDHDGSGGQAGRSSDELAASFGGPITIPHLFDGHDKLFFFLAYDKAHTRSAPAYSTASIPTTLMQSGDFTELLNATQSASTGAGAQNGPGYLVYDPTTQACTGSNCTRKALMGIKNGLPTPNIIPASMISPISQKMQSFLPDPSTSGIQNNFFGGVPSGYDNWLYSGRIDYTVSQKQTISFTLRAAIVTPSVHGDYRSSSAPISRHDVFDGCGPLGGSFGLVAIKPSLVNQFKFGFSNFGGPPVQNITQNTQYAASLMGINFSGVPADGQAVTEFPTQIFGGSNGQSEWGEGGSGVTFTSVVNAFTAVDNLFWSKGKHNVTFGAQIQWLEFQSSTYDGPTSSLTLNWGTNETAQESGSSYVGNTGYSYASYLLGAVGSTGISLQPFSVLGGRYRPIAPYIQDDYKVNSKLTLNFGLRWDYIPTYTEVQNRYSFLNPNIQNPVTGNLGTFRVRGQQRRPRRELRMQDSRQQLLEELGTACGLCVLD